MSIEWLKDVEKKLIDNLFIKEWKTYKQYLHYVLTLVDSSDLSELESTWIRSRIVEFLNCLHWEKITHDLIRRMSVHLWRKIMKESGNLEKYHEPSVNIIPLSAQSWQELWRKYDIIWLKDSSVAYRWWVARVIARHILWINQNRADLEHTLDDIDLYALVGSDHNSIIQQYGADSEWITYLDAFDMATIINEFLWIDITLNQLLVTESALYISDESITALRNWYTELVPGGRSFFWIQSYEIDWNIVYHPRLLMRWLKFLFEWKIEKLKLMSHNIQPKNLEMLWVQKQILVFIRRVYQKNLANKTSQLFALASMLKDWWCFNHVNDFFDYVIDYYNQNWFLFESGVIGIQKDAYRKLSKLIKIVIAEVLWEGDSDNVYANYDFSDTGFIIVSNDSKSIPASFSKKVIQFEEKYLSSYIEWKDK